MESALLPEIQLVPITKDETHSNELLIGTATLSLLKHLKADSPETKNTVILDLLCSDVPIGAVTIAVWQRDKYEGIWLLVYCILIAGRI